MAGETGMTNGDRGPERPRPRSEVAGPDRDTAAGDDRAAPDKGRFTGPGEPALRAALLALGMGVTWLALSRDRRRRAPDLW